jgi:fibronectin type 3 domain-containing protein
VRVLTRAVSPGVTIVCAVALLGGAAAGATSWVVVLHASSAGEGHAQTLPSAPTSVTASCPAPTTSKTITVTWGAVTHATTYSIYDSTTSATGTYTLVTSVSTTSYTSGTLATGNYWYEVTASIGTNWASGKSTASGESTIQSSNPFCKQP